MAIFWLVNWSLTKLRFPSAMERAETEFAFDLHVYFYLFFWSAFSLFKTCMNEK